MPPPPRPKMPLTYVVFLIATCRCLKGILGLGKKASENKLKDIRFIFPMTNITILGVFRTQVQKEYGKVWEMKSISILNILARLHLLKLAMHLLKNSK